MPTSLSPSDLCNHASDPTPEYSLQPAQLEAVSTPGSPTSPAANPNSPLGSICVYTRRFQPPTPTQSTLRRSTRMRRSSVLLDSFIDNVEEDNLTYFKVKHDRNWQQAMQKELDSIPEN
jgi:hypothetical protein